MKLSKAIKDLQARVDGEFSIKGVDDCKDMKLGIEALKEIQAGRVAGHILWEDKLPGETDD